MVVVSMEAVVDLVVVVVVCSSLAGVPRSLLQRARESWHLQHTSGAAPALPWGVRWSGGQEARRPGCSDITMSWCQDVRVMIGTLIFRQVMESKYRL